MKISDPSGRPVSGLAPASGLGGATRPANRATESRTGDQIQLSNLIAQLSANGSPEHVARLSRLGQVVAKGQYQVDSNAVSAAIIQDGLAFGRAA
jgi:anti-sigma28 factor (negative regulator of flagellin synthesis)